MAFKIDENLLPRALQLPEGLVSDVMQVPQLI